MRVVIADDETLLREGLARLLADAGFEVVGKAATPELLRQIELTRPDVALTDIRMPPTTAKRASWPRKRSATPSPTLGPRALALSRLPLRHERFFESHPRALGYLLKDRVSDIASSRRAAPLGRRRIVIDPTIVSPPVRTPPERRAALRAHRMRARGPRAHG